jgi:hypothetical protein
MIATTRAALVRGETTDDLGDVVDGNVVVPGFDDFAISIVEKSRQEFDEGSNAWRSVVYYVGRVKFTIPAKPGDRIRDNRDASFFNVESVKRTARGLSGRSSVTLTMKRTTP